ncbi:hypothetical protein C8N24_1188 [Solirubrobacter pauli]|uniref:Uncharacterized protein n=1 Tax=Solirubrobacter pauli TaxID=166793 RepID=A0A660LAE5_9ACTN|nr:hypothetical protein [Solirubrobacter pauli]RKQ91366.1 hypothetical protein C8N24_1188 [Solirubrobacter pauli]
MTRLAGLIAALAFLVALPASAQAATCTPPKYPGSGYFTSLKATKVSCGEASKVAVAFHKCRTKSSIKGRCTSKVRKFSCTEKRTTISTEINGRVTCKYGSRKVELTYQQNT